MTPQLFAFARFTFQLTAVYIVIAAIMVLFLLSMWLGLAGILDIYNYYHLSKLGTFIAAVCFLLCLVSILIILGRNQVVADRLDHIANVIYLSGVKHMFAAGILLFLLSRLLAFGIAVFR
jgi:hypothetical protein